MGVTLKQQRNGIVRPHWYGDAWIDGKRFVINLAVPVRGTPPESGSLRDTGDTRFEASRRDAEAALTRYIEDARHKGRAEHLTERLIESKTGRRVEYARLDALPNLWRSLGREMPACEQYLAGCDVRFKRFAAFMRDANPTAVHLYEVSPENAAAFVADIQAQFASNTARATIRLLNKAFSRFLPVGAANPFASFVGRRANGEGETIHRKPFTPEELKVLLETAREDIFMYPLIIAAACTGMRRGDVCALRWSAVDLKSGMLAVKTSKTKAEVEIPIFGPLFSVLKESRGNRSEYVFPQAARMLHENPTGLSLRFKKIVTKAFSGGNNTTLPPIVPAAEVEEEGVAAIMEKIPEGKRRNRMIEVFQRYCGGQSIRQIEQLGFNKATISADLHAVQEMIGHTFLPPKQGPSIKADIDRVTRVAREHGKKAASIRDWHALRSTFVTLALAAGVPVELVRRVTGHATVEIVLKHYFRPDREQFKQALAGAMPGILTGGKQIKPKPADELAALAAKVAEGSATDEDKARFKKLAAAV
jgi:integrase